MKTLLFLFCFIPCFAQSQSQDTICLPVERLGRIADTIAYLRQFERYAIISDSALLECKRINNALGGEITAYQAQIQASVKGNELLYTQLRMQKEMSEQWKQSASDLDKKFQKSKRAGRLWGALFGSTAGGGILAGVLIAILK